MQRFFILTSQPEFFQSFLCSGIIGKSLGEDSMAVYVLDLIQFCLDKEKYRGKGYGDKDIELINPLCGEIPSVKRLDDDPYGGGAGRVMRCEPAVRALRTVKNYILSTLGSTTVSINFSPRGEVLKQSRVVEYSSMENLILLCNRFEGVDERVIRLEIDREISIGDYVLMGGESASQIFIESVARLSLISDESLVDESFNDGLLEAPCYTRPASFGGERVPCELMSGNHKKIEEYKLRKSKEITRILRPDLYEGYLNRK